MKQKRQLHIYRQGRGKGAHWYFKPRYKTGRWSFDLGTNIEVEAQKKAQEIYHHLHATGWEETLKRYKPEAAPKGPPITVGEFVAAVERIYTGKRTSTTQYFQDLRRVAADLAGLPRLRTSDKKHNGAIRPRIDALPLTIFTRSKVQAWVKNYMAEGDPSPLAQKHRGVRANNYLNHLGALFGQERLELLGVKMEDPTDKIKRFTMPDSRFVPKVDINELYAAALMLDDEECVKAFVLLLCAGLRRAEADTLTWGQVLWDANMIRIETTKYFQPKVDTACGDVPIDEGVMELLHGWYSQDPEAEFVLAGGRVRLNHKRSYYRANHTFVKLLGWLRSQGITDQKPIHYLRKACGSLVNERGGIHEAKLMLRHSRIRTTESHYVSKQCKTTAGFGTVGAPKIVEATDKFKAA